MRKLGFKRSAIGVATMSAALLLGVAPGSATATSGPIVVSTGDSRCTTSGTLCVFESEQFTNGRAAIYQDVDSECVTTPFGVLADLNLSDKSIAYFRSADCGGTAALIMPVGDLHSWKSYGPMYSFRGL
ncbi:MULTISPECIES: hypothetical protein [unclassified Streptomyces]|uniref:hypothetical protein n=1 Tax=unclassified Streptomyces TaxID=2593676 RepID=UPI002E2D96A8|nr:hypothetical protein [Streptomyces sp. NBC_00223]